MKRAHVEPESIGHVVFGNVIHTDAHDHYLARVAAVKGGLPVATPGPTAAEIAIEDVIARYVKAMASLKSSEVSPLYESYSGSNRETVESLFRTYSSVQWIKTGSAKIEFSADGREATARIAGTKTLVNMRTRNQTTGGLSAEFQLVLTPAGWKIRTFRHLN